MAGTLTLDDESRKGPWDELIGRSAGSYRLVKLLGKGGMGAVYLARHPGIGSQVAVKFLHPRFAGDRAHVERFFNEARAVNLIGHENIVKTLDFSVTLDGLYYCVMEYLNGRPLMPGPVPLSIAGPIFLQCCRALQAAHERQIVHRDLKPDNVFLISQMGRANFVKLVDFGIAKLVDPSGGAGLTEVGALIGTPEYMSPEQAAGRSAEVGRRSDIYSLGVVMYQLATGRVPFHGASTAQTLVAQMQEKPPPLDESVPPSYAKVILKALEKDKKDRWQSMAELYDAILGCMKELGVANELPPAEPEPPPQTPEQMPRTDPRRDELPLTGTFAGDRAPMQARVERFADWAFAPPRRLRTVGALLAGVILIVLVMPRRQRVPPVPAPPPAAAVVSNPAALGPPRPPPEVVVVKMPPAPEKQHKKIATVAKPKAVVAPLADTPKPDGPLTAADAARVVAESRKAKELAAKARAEMSAAAAKAAQDDDAAGKPPPGVKLFVTSDPLGATVTAAWSGKSASGQTPIVFRVRRGATVTLSFSKQGYQPEVRDVAARDARAIAVELRPQVTP